MRESIDISVVLPVSLLTFANDEEWQRIIEYLGRKVLEEAEFLIKSETESNATTENAR
jgi:hypothetical protein